MTDLRNHSELSAKLFPPSSAAPGRNAANFKHKSTSSESPKTKGERGGGVVVAASRLEFEEVRNWHPSKSKVTEEERGGGNRRRMEGWMDGWIAYRSEASLPRSPSSFWNFVYFAFSSSMYLSSSFFSSLWNRQMRISRFSS